MICKLLILSVICGFTFSQWVSKSFGDYPSVVRYHNCDPCKIRHYHNLLATGIRNDSADFRCWLWSLAGRSLQRVRRILVAIPIEVEFCQGLAFDSILEVNISAPLNFSHGELKMLYKVRKFFRIIVLIVIFIMPIFITCLLYTSPSPRDRG